MSAGGDVKAGGAYVEITAETGPLEAGLKRVQDMLSGAADKMGQMGQSLLPVGDTIRDIFGPAMAGIGMGAAIKEATEAETSSVRLGMALKNTGRDAYRSKEDWDAYAESMRKTTTFGEEEIKNSAAQLAMFRSLNNVKLDEVLATSGDLASMMGSDLASASWTLGRALEDPETGMRRLKMQGIAFSDAQEKMMAKMKKANDVAGMQALIMKVVQDSTAGASDAISDTLGGAMKQLTNAVEEVAEEFGNLFLPILKDTTTWLIAMEKPIRDWISTNGEWLVVLVKTGAAIAGIGAALLMLSSAVKIVAALASPWMLVVAAVLLVLDALDIVNLGLDEMVGDFQVGGQSIGTWLAKGFLEGLRAWEFVKEGFLNGMSAMYVMFANVGEFFVQTWANASGAVANVFWNLVAKIGDAVNAIIGIVNKVAPKDMQLNLIDTKALRGKGKEATDIYDEFVAASKARAEGRWASYEKTRQERAKASATSIADFEDRIAANLETKKNEKERQSLRDKWKIATTSAVAGPKEDERILGGMFAGKVLGQFGGEGLGKLASIYGNTGADSKTDKLVDNSDQQTKLQEGILKSLQGGVVAHFA